MYPQKLTCDEYRIGIPEVYISSSSLRLDPYRSPFLSGLFNQLLFSSDPSVTRVFEA